MCLGEEELRDQVPFSSHLARVCTISMTYHHDVDLDHLAQVVFVRFLHCKVTLFPPPPFVLYAPWREVTVYSPYLICGELSTPMLIVITKRFSNIVFIITVIICKD